MTAEASAYAELENTLRQRRETLLGEIEQHLLESEEDRYRDIAHRVRDTGEASVADLIKGLDFQHSERLTRELEAVDRALLKFESGQYGLCEDCGTHIAIDRLRAEPQAARCITCQEKHEIDFESRRRASL